MKSSAELNEEQRKKAAEDKEKSQSARPRCGSKMTIIGEEGGVFFFVLWSAYFYVLIPFISAIKHTYL